RGARATPRPAPPGGLPGVLAHRRLGPAAEAGRVGLSRTAPLPAPGSGRPVARGVRAPLPPAGRRRSLLHAPRVPVPVLPGRRPNRRLAGVLLHGGHDRPIRPAARVRAVLVVGGNRGLRVAPMSGACTSTKLAIESQKRPTPPPLTASPA